jgi:predicted enzyme related to lactoylglutathione lyase
LFGLEESFAVPNTFDWIEIRTHHMDTAAEFYETLFGWKKTADGFDLC